MTAPYTEQEGQEASHSYVTCVWTPEVRLILAAEVPLDLHPVFRDELTIFPANSASGAAHAAVQARQATEVLSYQRSSLLPLSSHFYLLSLASSPRGFLFSLASQIQVLTAKETLHLLGPYYVPDIY